MCKKCNNTNGFFDDIDPDEEELDIMDDFEKRGIEKCTNNLALSEPQDATFYKNRGCIKTDNLVAVPEGCRNSTKEWTKNIVDLFGTVDCEGYISKSPLLGKAFVYHSENNAENELTSGSIQGPQMVGVGQNVLLYKYLETLFGLDKVFKYAVFIPIGGERTEVPKYLQFKGVYEMDKVKSAMEHHYVFYKSEDVYKF